MVYLVIPIFVRGSALIKQKRLLVVIAFCMFTGCAMKAANNDEVAVAADDNLTTFWLIGDSTMTDHRKFDGYNSKTSIQAGWGQMFEEYANDQTVDELKPLVKTDHVIVDDRAVGGRTSRSFFEEGRWRKVYNSIQPGDIVIAQFGHNDAGIKLSERMVERGYPEFVDLGYKEFLRLYVTETREKGGIPILLTPVARNYPWVDGKLENVHKKFPDSVKAIVDELDVIFIDLNQVSMDFFSEKGREYVTNQYFMNIPEGRYEKYPEGLKDNTHFQLEGAREVAKLVFEQLKQIAEQQLND